MDTDRKYWEEFFTTTKQLSFPQEIVIRFLNSNNFDGRKPLRMLDLGCGNGVNGLYAETLGYEVTFLDYSEQALANIKGQRRVINADIEKLGNAVADDYFNCIISTSVLYHFSKTTIKTIISDIHNKLTKGGVFFGNFISSKDPLVQKTTKENDIHYLENELWITSRNDGASHSKIIYENYDQDELKALFAPFYKMKLYPSSLPTGLALDAEISSRESFWICAQK